MRFTILLLASVWCHCAFAQLSISGKVADEANNPLQGATLVLEGTQLAIATDENGMFKFSGLANGEYVLKVSFVGYVTQVRKVDLSQPVQLDIIMKESTLITDEVIVSATRANDKTPTTFNNIEKEEIEKNNLGQDIPFLLQQSPSLVTTSDAGAGIGYTGIRIRGSDATRVNVTINGIPLNDSESQGVFWVNMPDFASSVESVQIQRGVGTSTNGAGAFGATVNLQTNNTAKEAGAMFSNSFGSFNTRKHTLTVNSGLLNDTWSFEGRLSKIKSDGFIDRASSDLQSYYLSGTYQSEKTLVKAVTFAGKEVTYQSWWGTPEARLENDVEGMQEVIINNGYSDEQAENLLNSGRTFNYYLYDNEVDNYSQSHYQLHLSQLLSGQWSVNAALHYTAGEGYFEQYREDDDFSDYGLDNVVIGTEEVESGDFIRRRWLDNDFYGFTYALNYDAERVQAVLGGGYNYYDGDHFGEIIWAEFANNSDIRERYYDNVGEKKDFNTFLKVYYQYNDRINLFGDAQVRTVDYFTAGIDSDLRQISTGENYAFFNPKVGINYQVNKASSAYASFAVANREPDRNDFVDAPEGQLPKHETLNNLEIGYRYNKSQFTLQANYYLMDYKNQLVLTGALNDVGSSIRANVDESYRTGIELQAALQLGKVSFGANATLSQNKIKEFDEVLYDYGENFDEFNVITNRYEDTDIAFSPNVIAGSQIAYQPVDQLELALLSRYVGKQFLDNTANEDRQIDAYFVNDLRLSYTVSTSLIKQMSFSLLVNNIFDTMYESNGYTFGYSGGDYVVRENYLYPQAGTNFLAGLSLYF